MLSRNQLTDKQRAVVEALRDRPSATARELADATGVSKRHVADTLARLVEHGTVACREGAGKWGADVYRALAGAAPTTVDLEGDAPAVKIASDRVWSTYTWALAIRPGGTTTAAGAPDARPDEPARVATDGGDPPPTDTD